MSEARIMAGADLAFVRDSAALVFVSEHEGMFRLEYERVWVPGKTPLRPSVVFGQQMREVEDWGAEAYCADDHYLASVIEVTEDHDVEHIRFPSDNKGIAEAFVRVRVLLGTRRVDLSAASPELVAELKETASKPLAGGLLSITHRRTPGSHGDRARAFVCAMYALELGGLSSLKDNESLSGGPRRIQRLTRYPNPENTPGYMRDLPPRR